MRFIDRNRAVAVAVLLVAALAAARDARADNVGVVVTGEPTMQPQLVNQLESWLRKNGHTLVSAPLPPDAINTLVDCFVIEDEGCARGVIDKRSKADTVVYARVDISAAGDLEKTVTVLAYWFEKGKPAVAERRFCQRCTDPTLRKTADEVIAALAKAGGQKGGGTLKLTTNPPGANCSIDGKPAGTTPVERTLEAGPHEITITRERHETETRFVTVKAGETETVDVALVASKGGGGGKQSTTIPIGLMAGGGAMVLTGAIMFAIDQDKGRDQPAEIRNTAPAGIGIGLTGAAIAVGGYLWFRSMSNKESAPVAAVSRDGAYVGWSSRF
jgi:hypothetical protein